MMAPLIVDLNKKGYLTEYCCQSHLCNRHQYILFKPGVYIPMDNIPNGYCVSISTSPNNNTFRIKINCALKNDNDMRYMIQLFNNLSSLYEWVKSLPVNTMPLSNTLFVDYNSHEFNLNEEIKFYKYKDDNIFSEPKFLHIDGTGVVSGFISINDREFYIIKHCGTTIEYVVCDSDEILKI